MGFRRAEAPLFLRLSAGLLLAYLLLSSAAAVWVAAAFDSSVNAEQLFDDAYYYLGVAFNLAHGEGSRFAQPLATNGYQPLWLLLLTAVIAAGSLTKPAAVVALVAVQGLVKCGALAQLCWQRSSAALPLAVAFGVGVLIFPYGYAYGLETVLLALLVLPLARWRAEPGPLRWAAVWPGALLFATAMLIRLDALSLLAGAWVVALLQRRAGANLLALSLLVALVLAAYMALNQWLFGLPLPVSGLSKALGQQPGDNLVQLANFFWMSKVPLVMALASLLLRWALRIQIRSDEDFSPAMALLLVSLVSCAAYYALFSGWPMWPWYYWSANLLGVFALAQLLLLGVALRREGRGPRPRVLLLGIGAAFMAYLLLVGARQERQRLLSSVAGLASVSGPLPSTLQSLRVAVAEQPNAYPYPLNVVSVTSVREFFASAKPGLVVMGDRAGGLGYWLPPGFGLLHSEGLVADASFLRARERGEGEAFITALKPAYFVVDRAALIELPGLHAIAEPVQAVAARSGVMLFCFPTTAVLYERQQQGQRRAIYDYQRQVPCPAAARQKLAELTATLGALRVFSLQTEVNGTLPPWRQGKRDF